MPQQLSQDAASHKRARGRNRELQTQIKYHILMTAYTLSCTINEAFSSDDYFSCDSSWSFMKDFLKFEPTHRNMSCNDVIITD
jgi:hypothetical protein